MSRVQIIGFWSLVHVGIFPQIRKHRYRNRKSSGCTYLHPGAPRPAYPKTVTRGAPPTPERLDNSQIGG